MPDPTVLSQSWKILPVPRDRSGRPEGMQILDEMGAEGDALFRIYRTIRTRAELGSVPQDDSEGTSPRSIADAGLRDAAGALGCAYDPGASPDQIAVAAGRLADLLDERLRPHSAAAFRSAAAAIASDDPVASLRAGEAMRALGRYSEAEIWLDRAIILARQRRDWRTYVRTYIAYGRIHQLRGNNPRAERYYRRALRRARRQALHRELGMAAHDLMMVELDRGHYRKARHLAELAMEGYGDRTCDVLRLAHDIGWQYLETGYPAEAAGLFRALLDHCEDPQVQLAGRANLCRAYGALGEEKRFRALRREVHTLAPTIPTLHGVSLVEVAIGARSLGDYETSQRDAADALEIAEERSHHRTAFRARAVLDSLGAPAEQAAPSDRRPFIEVDEVVDVLSDVCDRTPAECGANVVTTRQFHTA